jgi:hypothetical protein
MCSSQTGPRVQAFCDSVQKRDRRCVTTKVENIAAEVDEWYGFEAAHIFPLAYEGQWGIDNFERCITIHTNTGGSIYSVQNKMLLRSDVHQGFDWYRFSTNPNVYLY